MCPTQSRSRSIHVSYAEDADLRLSIEVFLTLHSHILLFGAFNEHEEPPIQDFTDRLLCGAWVHISSGAVLQDLRRDLGTKFHSIKVCPPEFVVGPRRALVYASDAACRCRLL
jgi:hypothetical protein